MSTISNQFLSSFHGLLFLFLFIELAWRTIIIIRFPYTFYETAQSEINLYFDFIFSVMWPVKVPKDTFDENNKVILVKQHRFPHGYVIEIPAITKS